MSTKSWGKPPRVENGFCSLCGAELSANEDLSKWVLHLLKSDVACNNCRPDGGWTRKEE